MSNVCQKKSQSSISYDKPSNNHSFSKDHLLPPDANQNLFRKKPAAGMEFAHAYSKPPSRQASTHQTSTPKPDEGLENSRVLRERKIEQASYNVNKSYATDLMKQSASHSTSIQDDQSRNIDEKHGSVQSTISANMKTSDGKLISYSMQLALSGSLLSLRKELFG